MGKLEHLKNQIEENIDWFDRESTKHKRIHRFCRYTVFGLTAISAILAGLAVKFQQFQAALNIGIITTTALIGAVTSFEGLRKAGELWVTERGFHYALIDLKRELDFKTVDDQADLNLDDYFDRFKRFFRFYNG